MAKLLVIDDSTADSDNLKKVLQNAGHQVIVANSGQEGIEASQKADFDAIFMDVVMDNIDGYRATREILENDKTKHIPIIMVTSKKQKADKVWAQLQGAKGYVTKPYADQAILDELSKVLG